MAQQSTNTSRRTVVIGLAAAGAAGTATVATPLFTDPEALQNILRPLGLGKRGVGLGTATSGDWALQEESLFTAETGHVLKLADVQVFSERTPRPAGLRDKAFVARFDIVRGGPMEGDKTYRFNHRDGGTFDMYLSSKNPANPLRMLAVFN